jgi:hypothetical protein
MFPKVDWIFPQGMKGFVYNEETQMYEKTKAAPREMGAKIPDRRGSFKVVSVTFVCALSGATRHACAICVTL